MIATFGKRPDGTHNDGINIAVPQGTEVHAAEGGRVAYAGNELKGYGNLVLIRHDNGWVIGLRPQPTSSWSSATTW